MRISDWSSDVCSSDLLGAEEGPARRHALCRDLCEGRTRRPGSAGARGVQQGRDDPRGQRRVAGVRNQCTSCTGWPEKNHAAALKQQRPHDKTETQSCREPVCQEGSRSEVAGLIKKKKNN